MEKFRTVRGVHDLLPHDLDKHMKVINSAIAGAEKTKNYTETKDDESKFGFWQWVWVFIVAKWLIIGLVNLISN